MRIILREDSEAVASTVATLFTLLAVVLFLQAAIVAVVPAKQYGAERTTSIAAISAFDMLRSTASGAVFPGGQVTVTLPIGTSAGPRITFTAPTTTGSRTTAEPRPISTRLTRPGPRTSGPRFRSRTTS